MCENIFPDLHSDGKILCGGEESEGAKWPFLCFRNGVQENQGYVWPCCVGQSHSGSFNLSLMSLKRK